MPADPNPAAPPGYRQGLISSVVALIKAGDRVQIGDLVALDGNYVRTFTWMDQQPGPTRFFDFYLGHLWDGATTGAETQDTLCTVYFGGQVYYPLAAPAAQYAPVGTLVTAVANKVVAADTTANASTMIGKVCWPVQAGDLGVMFELRSKVMS